ncbi:MAG: bifunctional DNA-formamidopyrimidine glycosylase/DNA-(apurinic or apyrimidinic site) lyase [Acidobacteria bacterium]|nr:bifunctional DNA-formamidopyrimidine glycosylase/DNA-(apurinic or apyrimidinic site) lyase [Acidobacteriota bacterium]
MPELPEVESLRRALRPLLEDRILGAVEVRQRSLRYPVDSRLLRRALPGRRITRLRRRGKYLLFDLDDGPSLLVHLGMSGRLALVPANRPYARHDHVAFGLEDGLQLRFNDVRRFGVIDMVPAGGESRHRLLAHLGIEPLEKEFNAANLRNMAHGRRCPVKTFIMDARHVVGVGNIYACEALFMAGIHPRRAAGRISPARWQRLTTAVRRILNAAIRQGGTTLRDYLNLAGEPGGYRRRLRVYGRRDEPCRRCRRPIRRVVLSGRGTFYCPGCQI